MSNEPGVYEGYSCITNDIKVSVEPSHLQDNSEPSAGVYAFMYTITIENLSKQRVKLLERHWVITSNGEHFAEVVGPGVVGEEPEISTGECYQYSSSAVIDAPIGAMSGTYTFRGGDGKYFEVQIPQFDLVCPVVYQ